MYKRQALNELTERGVRPQILFIEASDDVIVRRQEHVRRPHPLQGDGAMLDGIRRERAMLASLRASADMVVDTSDLNVHQLAERVVKSFNISGGDTMRMTLMSFGFKNGVPFDADAVSYTHLDVYKRQDLLQEVRGARVELRVPRRGDKRTLLETVERNAKEALANHKTRRASDLSTRNRALEEIQEALGLAAPPLRIECYDISHTQGTGVVGSMVVFEDGLPRKSDYRTFLIKTVEGSNDVGAINEVLTRRFRRLLDDRAASTGDDAVLIDPTTGIAKRFAYAPGLVVVDGGAPQVAAARAAMAELGITDIPLIGLAQRLEEVWLPGEEFPLILPRTSEGLYLLQRVRDEAHRFAITHHRKRRSKSMVESLPVSYTHLDV